MWWLWVVFCASCASDEHMMSESLAKLCRCAGGRPSVERHIGGNGSRNARIGERLSPDAVAGFFGPRG